MAAECLFKVVFSLNVYEVTSILCKFWHFDQKLHLVKVFGTFTTALQPQGSSPQNIPAEAGYSYVIPRMDIGLQGMYFQSTLIKYNNAFAC